MNINLMKGLSDGRLADNTSQLIFILQVGQPFDQISILTRLFLDGICIQKLSEIALLSPDLYS